MNIKTIKENLCRLLYPDFCPFCSHIIEHNEIACKKCLPDIPKAGIQQGIKGGYRCVSPLIYTGKYRKCILNFKLKRRTQSCDRLAMLMYDEICRSYSDMIFDYVTYVPMYEKDLKKRGFNQSEMLAQSLSKMMGIPCKSTLAKIKRTKPQHKLLKKERVKNLIGAFKVIDAKAVNGRSILIVDDIVTTGSTLGECAKMLKKSKPGLICCVTLESALKR